MQITINQDLVKSFSSLKDDAKEMMEMKQKELNNQVNAFLGLVLKDVQNSFGKSVNLEFKTNIDQNICFDFILPFLITNLSWGYTIVYMDNSHDVYYDPRFIISAK